MSLLERGKDGRPLVTLPPILDLTVVASLKLDLLAALGLAEGLEVDASNVQRVTTPCLQLMVSAARSFAEAGGPSLKVTGATLCFDESATALGLAAELGLEGNCHE